MDFDHPTAFGFGLLELQRVDEEIFSLLQFKPFGLFCQRYGHFFIGTDHLLVQFHPITPVEQVKLYPVFLDRGMQLHGHIRIRKMDIPFPDRSSRH